MVPPTKTPDLDPLRSAPGTAAPHAGWADQWTAASIEELILAAPSILGVDSVALLLRGRIQELRLVSWSDDVAAALALSSPLLAGEWLVRVDRGEVVPVDDVADVDHGDPDGRVIGGARSMLSMPIVVGDRTIGAFVVADRCAHPWHHLQERAVRAYASVLTIALNWSAQALQYRARGEQLVNRLGLDADADPISGKR